MPSYFQLSLLHYKLFNFIKEDIIFATSALVAVFLGFKLFSGVPLIISFDIAHCIASLAYSLTVAPSLKSLTNFSLEPVLVNFLYWEYLYKIETSCSLVMLSLGAKISSL